MNRIHTLLAVAILAFGLVLLTGCVAPQFTRHDVHIETSPPGAEIVFSRGASWFGLSKTEPMVICAKTPCTYDVRDHFGWISPYIFVARKEGYQDATLVIEERHIFDSQGIVPSSLQITMVPR